MPCQDGGYAPSPDEIRKSQEAVKRTEQARKKRLDDLSRMLCTLANATEGQGYGMMTDFGLSKGEKTEILTWLKAHNKADATRRRKEEARKQAKLDKLGVVERQAAAKKSAIAKLTSEERKALGF